MVTSGRQQQALTRERILDAAQAIVTEEGLEAVSMRRVAAALGAGAMSLYNHVPNKEALLGGLAERVFSQVQVPQGASRRELAGSWARSVRSTLIANRQMLPLVLARSQRALLIGIARPLVESLVATGMSVDDARDVTSVLGRYVAGALIFDGASSAKRKADRTAMDRPFEVGLTALLDGLPALDG